MAEEVSTNPAAAGVALVGYVHAENGIGELPRGIAASLHAASVPYCVVARRGRPADGRDVAFAREALEW